jgi:hypothetical protein
MPGLLVTNKFLINTNIVVGGGGKNVPGSHLKHQTFWHFADFWFIN